MSTSFTSFGTTSLTTSLIIAEFLLPYYFRNIRHLPRHCWSTNTVSHYAELWNNITRMSSCRILEYLLCHHILPIIGLLLNYVFILRRLLNYFYYLTISSQLQTSTTSRAMTGYCCFSVDNYIVNICIVQLLCTWTLFLCMYISVIICVYKHAHI